MSDERLQILEPEQRSVDPGPDWLHDALAGFRQDLLHPEYPCNFGRTALKHRELYMTWVDHGDFSTLPRDLATFVDVTRKDLQRRQPLAVFVEPAPEPMTAEDFDRQFWSLLQYLHDHDDRPWPADVPADSRADGWQFAFHGQSIFVFAVIPTNKLRRSRNLCNCMVLLFQPRNVFVGVEVGTPAGDAARRSIRKRLAKWDVIGPHPSFGNHDQLSDDEWRQYLLTDENVDLHPHCPLVIRAGKKAHEHERA